MARTPLSRTSDYAYHVTIRTNNKEWFHVPIARCWSIFREHLLTINSEYEVHIHAFVLMSNHFHLIVTTPRANLDLAMRYFLTESAKAILQDSDRINHVFGGRYKWTLLDSPVALAFAYKYVARNPVRAGLCKRVEDYPYSTFHSTPRFRRPVPVSVGITDYWKYILMDPEMHSAWLNKPTPKEREGLIKKALRRSVYKFSSRRNEQSAIKALGRDYEIPLE